MFIRIVRFDVNQRHVEIKGDRQSLDLSSVFCGHEEKRGVWSLPWSPLAVEGYLEELRRRNIKVIRSSAFNNWLDQEIALREGIKLADRTNDPGDTRFYRHQMAFASRTQVAPDQYDASEVGTGKSVSALAAVRKNNARTVMIVCPKVIQHQWQKYVEDWTDLCPIVFGGSSRASKEEILRNLQDRKNYALIITWGSLPRYTSLLENLDWDAIICDEFHMARNRKTKRFEALMKLSAPSKIALSGTPFEHSAADVWTFLAWIDRRYKRSGYWRFAHQAANVTHDRWADVWTVEGIRNPDIFADIMSPYMRRLELQQLEDIPDIVWEFVPIELTPEHYALYSSLAQSYIRTEHPITTAFRLRRMTVDPRLEGFAWSDDLPKLQYLEDISKGTSHLLVYATLLDILRRGQEQTDGLWLTGEVKDRESVVEKFEVGGTLCMTVQMGIGLDFPFCDHIYILDAPWSAIQFTQAIGRIRRLGGGKSVVIYPYAVGTIDERIAEVLDNKTELSRIALEKLIVDHVEGL